MSPLYIQNLGMIITNKCNLDCDHCMRGEKCDNKSMTKEVIKATLEQVTIIGNLCICGGEPLLALNVMKNIFDYIIENIIFVDQVSLVTNGSIYSEEFLNLLERFESYLKVVSRLKKNLVTFAISYDEYHLKELKRLGLINTFIDNVKKYSESKYFVGFQPLTGKLFREGNACNLDLDLTVPMRPMGVIMTYVGKHNKLNVEEGLCNIGPIVTVNVNGTITECDASLLNQETLYNYGNVLHDSIIDVFLERESEVLKPKKWFKEAKKLMLKYATYDK